MLVAARDTGERSDGARMVDAGPLGRVKSRAPQPYAWIEELVGGGAVAEAGTVLAVADGATPGRGMPRVLTLTALADPRLRPLADRAVEGWALLIAHLCVLLDHELVVLTGGLAEDAAHLLEPLRRRVAELINPKMRASPRRIEPNRWHWKSLH